MGIQFVLDVYICAVSLVLQILMNEASWQVVSINKIYIVMQ